MDKSNQSSHGQYQSPLSKQNIEITSSPAIESTMAQELDNNFYNNLASRSEPSSVNNEQIYQINLTKKGDIVLLELPASDEQETNQWLRIINNFKFKLSKIDKSWQQGTKVKIQCHNQLLDTRQLSELENILEQVGLVIDVIITRRRNTAVTAASAGYSVEQKYTPIATEDSLSTEIVQELAEPLYLKNTIRSGMEIFHPSSIIIIGDVNPGATIVSTGDVLVWGNLKGVAHAGVTGNHQSIIMALKMKPTQLRIADLVAIAPEKSLDDEMSEIAYISSEGIKIHVASNFHRYHGFVAEKNCWVTKNKDNFKL